MMTENLMPEGGQPWLVWAKKYLSTLVPSSMDIDLNNVGQADRIGGCSLPLSASRQACSDDEPIFPLEVFTHPCHVYRYLSFATPYGGDADRNDCDTARKRSGGVGTISKQIRQAIVELFETSQTWLDIPDGADRCFHHPYPVYTQAPWVLNAVNCHGQQHIFTKPVQLLVYYLPCLGEEAPSLPYPLSNDAIKGELWLTGFTDAWVWLCTSSMPSSLSSLNRENQWKNSTGVSITHRWVTLTQDDVDRFNRRAASVLAFQTEDVDASSIMGSALQRAECCQCPYFNWQCFPTSKRIC